MYIEYFKLNEAPFKLTPNPRYLFMSGLHREGLAHLIYGVRQPGGFVQLTGEVGSGKTTLCHCLISQLPQDTEIALILNPKLTVIELLATICDELRIAYPPETASIKILIDALNQRLLETHAQGRRTVLIIDEAQNLRSEVLEQIRLLTNLETSTEKLLQIILIGQPELLRLLKRRNLRQLSQRITARYHLEPLSRGETHAYVRHRLLVAGRREPLFTRRAVNYVYRMSGGIPRLINIICDRALLGAYAQDERMITPSIIRQAAREACGLKLRPRRPQPAMFQSRRFRIVLRTSRIPGFRLVWPATIILFALAAAAFMLFSPIGSALWKKDDPKTVSQNGAAQWSHEVPETVSTIDSAQWSPDDLEAVSQNGAAQRNHDDPEAVSPNDSLAEEASTPVLVEMLFDAPQSAASGFAELLAMWGVAMPDDSPSLGCVKEIVPGFECLHLFGGWPKLRRFDLPAILDLLPPGGTRRRVVLSGLDDETATLIIHGRTLNVSIPEIARLWDGSFMLLWKPPVDERPVPAGATGESVKWIQRAMDRLDGKPESDVSGVFDGELRQRVLDFQKKHSLIQDGIAGNETLARLALLLEGAESLSLTGRAQISP